jgi:hypothetical protein
LYSCDIILERLTQHFEHIPLELGKLIEEEDAVVGQRHLAPQGHLAAADTPHIGNGLVGSAKGSHGDKGGAPPRKAADAMEAGGLDGFGQGHLGEDRRQASGQPRLPRHRRPQEQDVMGTTPASGSAWHHHRIADWRIDL